MYSIVSAYNLCRKVDVALSVIWFRDHSLNARFREIFRPMECDDIRLRDSVLMDYFVNDRPRRKNFYVPYLFQKFKYERAIYEKERSDLKESGADFEGWALGRNCYMSNYQEFGDYDKELLSQLFRPIDEVMDRVMTMDEKVDRASVSGIRGGLVDMWTLSRTKRIFGSANSTFSMAAAAIGNTGLTILRK